MQIRLAKLWRETGLLMGSPLKDEFARVTIGVAGEDLAQDAVRIDVTNTIEIKRESRRPRPLLRLKELAQFVRTAVTCKRGVPDMDLASLELGAIWQNPLAPTHLRGPAAG